MTLQVAEPGDPPTLCRVSPAHLSTQPHLSLQCFGVWGAQDTPRSDLLFAACWGGRGLGTPFRARLRFRGLWLQSLKLGIPSLALGVSPEHFWGSSLGFFFEKPDATLCTKAWPGCPHGVGPLGVLFDPLHPPPGWHRTLPTGHSSTPKLSSSLGFIGGWCRRTGGAGGSAHP